MCHRTLVALAVYLFIGVVGAAQAQNSSPGAPAPPPNQAASGSVNANSAAASPTAPAPPPAKKVWTNDDVTDLRGVAPVSTVGSTGPTGGKKPKQAANRNPRGYQAQIARLESQIPSLDAQIAELQAAINGKPTGDAKTSQRPRSVKADDWNVEMQELQKKKQDILDQIAALNDEARHQGVPPNTLP